MARRWQLSLWVLAGLVITVVALWESATMSVVAERVTERTETVDGSDLRDDGGSSPSDLAFGGDGPGLGDPGDANLLRPTTTTTTLPTTTTSTTASSRDATGGAAGQRGEQDPGGVTTTPASGAGDTTETTRPGGSTATTPDRSSTTVNGTALTTVYHQDFASGSLADGQWGIADSIGHDGWGLRRPSSVSVTPDPSAAGGHVLAITARMGTGAEAGQLVSGAVSLLGRATTYGRYTIRARVDADPDGATSGVVLLQPAASAAPGDAPETGGGEIRLMETSRNRTTRTPVESTVRWIEQSGVMSVDKAHRNTAGPVSAAVWHVYTLQWTADRVSVSIDGGVPLTLTTNPERIPHGPMDLAIRLDALDTPSAPGEQPTLSGDVHLLIDWIRIETEAGQPTS